MNWIFNGVSELLFTTKKIYENQVEIVVWFWENYIVWYFSQKTQTTVRQNLRLFSGKLEKKWKWLNQFSNVDFTDLQRNIQWELVFFPHLVSVWVKIRMISKAQQNNFETNITSNGRCFHSHFQNLIYEWNEDKIVIRVQRNFILTLKKYWYILDFFSSLFLVDQVPFFFLLSTLCYSSLFVLPSTSVELCWPASGWPTHSASNLSRSTRSSPWASSTTQSSTHSSTRSKPSSSTQSSTHSSTTESTTHSTTHSTISW